MKYLARLVKKIFKIKSHPSVAVLNLYGVIGKDSKLESGINFNNCSPLIKKAFEQKDIKAVVLNINSPGGSPVQSELIYNYIRELSIKKKIPVYSFAQDVSASGGYWLLLAGDEIYGHNSSIIGSIGVIFSSFGFVDLIKKIGINRRVYTEGKNKAILDPFLPEEQENIIILKAVQKDIYDSFVDLVKTRRSGKLKNQNDDLFSGAFWSGKKSFELGLIDGISDFRSKIQEKFGDDVEFININSKKSFIKNLISEKILLGKKNFIQENIIYPIEETISFNKFGL
jgi:signal peptide peptidase SppA